MKLKLMQLVGMLSMLCAMSTMLAAAAIEGQLTQVQVSSRGNVATVTLRTTGAFTHTEYRPTENLLLVDMAGISATSMDDKTHAVHAPNLVSYRILGYKGGDGKNVARVEFAVVSGAKPSFVKARNQLRINIAGDIAGDASAVALASTSQSATTADTPVPTMAAASHSPRITEIRKVGVIRGKNGLEVEISANAPLSPNAIKLTAPDRVVVDLANAVPDGRNKTIAVNSGEVKSIRIL